jgi:hypothetical protein
MDLINSYHTYHWNEGRMGAGAPGQKFSADNFSQLNPGQPAIPLMKHIHSQHYNVPLWQCRYRYIKPFKRKIEKHFDVWSNEKLLKTVF